MPVDYHADSETDLVTIKISGKLTTEDYKRFIPELETFIQEHGGINVLFQMVDFHGWEFGAMWEDLKFDMKHFSDMKRLAIVGEKKWHEWMAKVCVLFTKAEIQYFPSEQLADAKTWLTSEEM